MNGVNINSSFLRKVNIFIGPGIDNYKYRLQDSHDMHTVVFSHIHPMKIESELKSIIGSSEKIGLITHNFDVIASVLIYHKNNEKLNDVCVIKIGTNPNDSDDVKYLDGDDAYALVCERGADIR